MIDRPFFRLRNKNHSVENKEPDREFLRARQSKLSASRNDSRITRRYTRRQDNAMKEKYHMYLSDEMRASAYRRSCTNLARESGELQPTFLLRSWSPLSDPFCPPCAIFRLALEYRGGEKSRRRRTDVNILCGQVRAKCMHMYIHIYICI